MNTKALLISSFTALVFNWSGVAMAVSPEGGVKPMEDGSPAMGADISATGSSKMHDMKQGNMMGMMSGCPMMSAASGPNGKVMMQMHGEMMRAMGDIMMKYADKLHTPAANQ